MINMKNKDFFNGIQLKRGADGWRGIIGERFSVESSVKLALSIGEFLLKKIGSGTILVTHDDRFMSNEVALSIVEALENANYDVAFGGLQSTPTSSYALKSAKYIGAILVTASHNPFYWNGIKIKISPGIPPSKQDECFIDNLYNENITTQSFGRKGKRFFIKRGKLIQDYVNGALSALNMHERKNIRGKKFKIVVDSLHGVASKAFEELLKRLGCEITLLGNKSDPLFNGLCPDPMNPESRKRIVSLIKNGNFDLGFITDGDGDRLCVIDELGNFVWPHDILALKFETLMHSKNLKGGIAVTGPTGSIVQRVCEKFSRQCFETPVGFKHVSPFLQSGEALIAGGAVGEIAYREFSYDRDPLTSIVKLLNICARNDCSFSKIIKDLRLRYGESAYKQWTISCKSMDKIELKQLGLELINKMGYSVINTIDNDGYKFVINKTEWVLVRNATTEGGVRIYAELKDEMELNKLLKYMFEITQSFPIEKA